MYSAISPFCIGMRRNLWMSDLNWGTRKRGTLNSPAYTACWLNAEYEYDMDERWLEMKRWKRDQNCVQRMDLVESNGAQSKAKHCANQRERAKERIQMILPIRLPTCIYSYSNLHLCSMLPTRWLIWSVSISVNLHISPSPSSAWSIPYVSGYCTRSATRLQKRISAALEGKWKRTAAAAGRGRRENYAKRSCKDADREL